MSVGLLIITHQGIGDALLQTIQSTFGEIPLTVHTISVAPNSDPDAVYDHALELAQEIDSGDGVLFLGDLFGATPSNIAVRLTDTLETSELVCGINLPMLMRIMNYAHMPLSDLAHAAQLGGSRGVTRYPHCQLPE